MSQDSAALPSTQLELDEFDDGYFSQSESMPSPAAAEYEHCDSEQDPPSNSCTPSPHSTPAHLAAPSLKTPQQQQSWSQHAGCPFEHSRPIEAQLSSFLMGDRFQLRQIIGHGSFGFTYKAQDTLDDDIEVAVKVAKGRTYQSSHAAAYQYDDFLQVEWGAFQGLASADAAPITGFPCVVDAGVQHFVGEDCTVFSVSYMAMELLGNTCWSAANSLRRLQDLAVCSEDYSDDYDEDDSQCAFQPSPRMPSTAWIVKTGKGMLKALADVHRRGFIHRDVKTENFCLDVSGSNDSIKIIDFGFSRLAYGYYSFHDYHQPCASFWGTPNYASLAALKSLPQSPRDDLECLVYCLFEMEHPNLRLPWNNDLTTNDEAKEGWSMQQLKTMSKKKEKAWRDACKRGEVPPYLAGFFDYITSLSTEDVPDYPWLLMQLDSGVTGQPPANPPVRCKLADWPTSGIPYSRKEYAQYAMSQIAAAASKILPPPSAIKVVHAPSTDGQQRGSKRARVADSEALPDQQQYFQRHVKHQKVAAWPDQLSDDEKPSSLVASMACGPEQVAGMGGELLQLASAPHGTTRKLRSSGALPSAVPVLRESPEE